MLLDIPEQSEVFVDANIFVYHFSGPTEYTDSCSRFLQRVEEGRLLGLTSALVLAETLHRLMIIEATSKLQIEPRTVVHYLKEHSAEAKQLTDHLVVPEKVQALGIKVVPADFADVVESGELKKRYGLLTNDSITLAFMKRREIINIATNDPDFDRVPDIKVWKPTI